ncbi:MAG: hypothetical protein LC808_13935 [Actinobacteria bacterium]|nr:hypothetical protein [Actinomycetota bacterium]
MWIMDAALAGLLGTATGAAAGIIGAALSARHQRLLEAQRVHAAHEAELVQLEREALLELAKAFAAALTTVLYVTWYAWKIPERVTSQALAEYEETMKELFGTLVATHLVAAGMSGGTFAAFDPLIRRLHELDEQIALEIGRFDREPDSAREAIGSLHQSANSLERESRENLRSVLQLRRLPRDTAPDMAS